MKNVSKKKRIALIGLSALLLGMIPVLVILDPVGFRNMEELTELTAEVPRILETCDPETAEMVKVITAESLETDPDVTLSDNGDLVVNLALADDDQYIVVLAERHVNYPTTLTVCKSGGSVLIGSYPLSDS